MQNIKELCMKAIMDVDGIENPDTAKMYIPDCFRDRFAELIILECCKMANDRIQWNNPNDCLLVLDIKEHYGLAPWQTED